MNLFFDRAIVRRVIAGAGAVLFLAWGGHQVFQARTLETLDAQAKREPLAFWSGDDNVLPDNAELLTRAGLWRERRFFPADHAGAAGFYRRALALKPGDAATWMRLARALLFQGLAREAEITLERSDALDPNYPSQRLGAIQLWHLLGKPDRGLAMARSLSEMSPGLRVPILDEFRRLGYEPPEMVQALELDQASPEEVAELLPRLNPTTQESARELFASLPPEFFEDRAFQDQAVLIASRFTLPDTITRLWKARAPSAFEPTGEPPLRFDLAESPFNDPFYLGWQPEPSGLRANASWQSLDKEPGSFIRLTFRDPLDSSKRHFKWLFCRLLLPPGGACEAVARIRLDSSDKARCSLRVAFRGAGAYQSPQTEPKAQGWQEIAVALPERPDWSIVEIFFQREAPSVSNGAGLLPRADLGPLVIRPLEESAP